MVLARQKHWIGVDMGGTNVRAGLVVDGKLVKFEAMRHRSHGTKNEVFADLCHVIDAVITPKVAGLGIGTPSLVEPNRGLIQSTTNIPAWRQVPLRSWLEKRYGVPVRLSNDAKCFALGERIWGYGKDHEDFVGLIIGTGLGAGIVANGRLVSGSYCGAGEFGLMPFRDSIVEHYASGQFFRRNGTNGAQLHLEAAAGDKRALALFDEYGRNLGHAVKLILLAFAPPLIILGGAVSQSYSMFKRSLHECLNEDFPYPFLVKNLKIKVSKVKHVAILGAAQLMREE